MDEPVKKRVDESWKEQAAREKRVTGEGTGAAPSRETQVPSGEAAARAEGFPEARFDLFISGLAMEALIALGELPHPTTRKQEVNLRQARYLVDLLGVFEEKTKNNLSVDEERVLKDTLYQLRMRYLKKAGG